MTFHAQILTLYPEMFPGPLGVSLAGKALAEGIWECSAINIRDFATDRHHTVDDTPAGGGAGMVLKVDVLARAVDFAAQPSPLQGRGKCDAKRSEGEGESVSDQSPPLPGASHLSLSPEGERIPILAMTPRGTPITQSRIRQLAQGPGITILCGRFEGFDERLFEARPHIEQVSMGDIILSGGEIAALTLLDACIRLLPGVMGAASSGEEESFEQGLLEYPHYTRPAEWEGRMIPQVLRSGDHAKIKAWRQAQSEIDTRLRRPDLWERHVGTRVQPASGARQKNKD